MARKIKKKIKVISEYKRFKEEERQNKNNSIIANVRAQRAIEEAKQASEELARANLELARCKKIEDITNEIDRLDKEIEQIKNNKKALRKTKHKKNLKNKQDAALGNAKGRRQELIDQRKSLNEGRKTGPQTIENAQKATKSAMESVQKASSNYLEKANIAKGLSKVAGQLAPKALAAASAPLLYVLGIVVIVIVVIIAVLGMLFFFIALPGMVRGKIEAWINEAMGGIDRFFNGKEQAINMITMNDLVENANYLESMGYDLNGMGFLSEEIDDKVWSAEVDGDKLYSTLNKKPLDLLENSKNLKYTNIEDCPISERKSSRGSGALHTLYVKKGADINETSKEKLKNIVMSRDEEGNIAFIKSKYLIEYIASDNATYLVRNYNLDAWERFLKNFGSADMENGSGMIFFPDSKDKYMSEYFEGTIPKIINEQGIAEDRNFINAEDQNSFFKDRVKVNRARRVMRIDNIYNNPFVKTWYDYSLDGWVTKYGVPWQLCMAIHTASLSPDFAEKFALRGVGGTTVEMGLVPTLGNNIEMLLNIDTDGDGQKELVKLERELKMFKHKNVDGSDEHYSSVNEVLSKMQLSEEEKNKIQEQQLTLEKFEEELNAVTNNGNNKIILGSIGVKSIGIYVDVEEEPKDINDENIYVNIDYDNEYFKNLIALMCEEKIIVMDTSKNRLIKNVNVDINRYNKAKEIFEKYFKLNEPNVVWNEMVSKYNLTGFDEIDFSNVNKEESLKDYFYTRVCNITIRKFEYIEQRFGDKISIGTEKLLWDWYITGEIDFGTKKGIDNIVQIVQDIIPVRYHYQLVDFNGKIIKYNDEKKQNLPPEDFLGSSTTYFPDPDNTGYFYGGKIPKKIVSMLVGKKEEDLIENDGVNAKVILDKVNSVHYQNVTKLVPIILDVKNHWYRDLSFKKCYRMESNQTIDEIHDYSPIESDSEPVKSAAENDILKLSEIGTEKVVQIKEPASLKEGVWLRGILDEKYYIYDGIHRSNRKMNIDFTKKILTSNGKEYQKLSSVNDSIIAMLEQIEGEDAQYIIRMFKEFLATQGIQFLETEMTGDKIDLFKRVIQNYANTDMLYTLDGGDMVYRSENVSNPQGFAKDLIVQAPAKGKIIYKTETAVGIEIDDSSEKLNKYTIIISGFKVDSNIQVDSIVEKNIEIGRTTKDDISMALRDEDLNIVRNKTIKTQNNQQLGKMAVLSPVDGTITACTKESVTIEPKAGGNKNPSFSKVIIENFEVDPNIKMPAGITVQKDEKLGYGEKGKFTIKFFDNRGKAIKFEAEENTEKGNPNAGTGGLNIFQPGQIVQPGPNQKLPLTPPIN